MVKDMEDVFVITYNVLGEGVSCDGSIYTTQKEAIKQCEEMNAAPGLFSCKFKYKVDTLTNFLRESLREAKLPS